MSLVPYGPGGGLSRLDQLVLTTDQDGSHGTNRAYLVPKQIAADDDRAAIRAFLAEYRLSPATQRSYHKEIERLLLWAVHERGQPLSSLTREDFAAYARFLEDPQPRDRWCGPRSSRAKSDWHPFLGPLGPSARHTALVIVNSLMNYLVQAGYLAGNPLALIRQRDRGESPLQTSRRQIGDRCLDDTQWQALRETLEALPKDTPQDQALYERVRFLVALLYFLALRVGEIETHRMGDFVEQRGKWMFRVLGKGRKEAEVPVGPQMLDALRQYRLYLGLSPLPGPQEQTPLVQDLSPRRDEEGRGPLTARRINQLLKDLCSRAADRLEQTGEHPSGVAALRRASAHWFRHTALTRQWEKGIDVTHIKANARHSRLDTTLLYVHLDEDARHEEIKKHTW